MIATHATKAGVRYRYYVSRPSVHGEARTARLGSVSRVPAGEIEQAVVAAIKEQLRHQKSPTDRPQPIHFDRKVLGSLVARIEVQTNRLAVSLKPTDHSAAPELISVAWQKPPSRRSQEILLPHGTLRENIRPERAERRARLVTAIARGRRWLDELSSGAVTDAQQLAKRERCTVRQVNLTLSLAFLAPQLVKAAVEGRLPRGINLERLRDLHAEWRRQVQELGLDPH
jgi:hypothetical protein